MPDRTEPDVKVEHKSGCGLDGRTDQHTHPQAEWRAHIDTQDPWAAGTAKGKERR